MKWVAMLSYGQLERALAALNNINEKRLRAFRARLTHFRTIGLVPAAPGRGKRVSYTLEDAQIWALALEIAQFHTDPLSIKRLVDYWKPQIIEAFAEADQGPEFLYIVFGPSFVTHAAEGDGSPLWKLQKYRAGELAKALESGKLDNATGLKLGELDKWLGRRGGLVNLTWLKVALDRALSEAA